ncbi:MAG: DUF3467 domain-containing protein, partial [Nitrospira sp.]|nr:DUF3467 domain-containing protein [Nitrospira sp.]
ATSLSESALNLSNIATVAMTWRTYSPQEIGVREVSRNDNEAAQQTQTPTDQRRIRFDSTNSKNSYADTCHVASTKEEVVLNFGPNQSLDQGQPDIQLANRIILSLFAAKRLTMFFKQGTFNLPEE